MRRPLRTGFPPRPVKHGVFLRMKNGSLRRDRVSMTTLYRLPPRATPPCAGSLVMRRNQDKKHWMSGHALPEPSAQMNTDCSICRGMSGNGPTAALFGNRLMQAASLLVLRRPIVGCESSKMAFKRSGANKDRVPARECGRNAVRLVESRPIRTMNRRRIDCRACCDVPPEASAQGDPAVQARLEGIGVGHDHRARAMQSQIDHGPRHGMGADTDL